MVHHRCDVTAGEFYLNMYILRYISIQRQLRVEIESKIYLSFECVLRPNLAIPLTASLHFRASSTWVLLISFFMARKKICSMIMTKINIRRVTIYAWISPSRVSKFKRPLHPLMPNRKYAIGNFLSNIRMLFYFLIKKYNSSTRIISGKKVYTHLFYASQNHSNGKCFFLIYFTFMTILIYVYYRDGISNKLNIWRTLFELSIWLLSSVLTHCWVWQNLLAMSHYQ